ncbi:MAG: ferrous iron transport protein B [Oscillospiraceae bacterium]|nr:ferrous iron transport protein B [Oscillospiraceae bacterium]
MNLRIALAGNPNCGKTTLFNALTGSNQFVGNWPGVTVEKKEGKLKKNEDIIITDLPGIYSLSPYTLEEVVARNYLISERPDAILNIVDGTNIERNLYLTTQLIELGIPVVIAINMMDIVEKSGDKIDIAELSRQIGCKVVQISALKGTGIIEAVDMAIEAARSGKALPMHIFSGTVEHALAHIEEAAVHSMPEERQRWYAVKIFERDEKVAENLNLSEDILSHIETDIKAVEKHLDDDAESIIANERYLYIAQILKTAYKKKKRKGLSTSDKIDKIVTNRFLAIPIFALVMFIVYYISVTTVGAWVTDWTNDVLFGEIIPPVVERWLTAVNCADWLQGLILDGIIGGVGAVLGFIPQMLVLFIFLAFLEACGYMARIAFVMDKIFRRFGLSGKSFIPMLIGTGCSVPGIMASRTIESERDRRMTIITTSFIPCGAKLPVIALISGVMFGKESAWVATGAFFIGIVAIVLSGIMLKKTKLFAGDPAPFVMELPAYHMPTIGNVLRSMWERGWSFIKKAGTVILLSTVVLWFLQSYGFENGVFGAVESADNSILAYIGKPIAILFIPLGFGLWQAAVATITGLIAKENIVATFGVLYGVAEIAENGEEIWGLLANDFTQAAALSFLIFNLLCAPCFAAIGAIRREMNSTKWTLFAIGYQTIFAYAVSLIVYQIGAVFAGEGNIIGVIAAVAAIAVIIYMLGRSRKKLPKPMIKLKTK